MDIGAGSHDERLSHRGHSNGRQKTHGEEVAHRGYQANHSPRAAGNFT